MKNNSIVLQYYVEANHESIFPQDIYMSIQEEMVRQRTVSVSADGKKRSYSSNHCFVQIVNGSEFGQLFRRIHRYNRSMKSFVCLCIISLEAIGLSCHARTVNELDVEKIVVLAIYKVLSDKSRYQEQLLQNIATVIQTANSTLVDIYERLL